MISVIIPAYNAGTLIEDSIKSALSQDCDLEVICVDDGSEDDTYKRVEALAESDTRLILIRQSNGGRGSARNTGLMSAKGDYIFFLDADDLLEVGALGLLLSIMERDKADYVIGRNESFNSSRRWIFPSHKKFYKMPQIGANLTNFPELLRDSSACGKLFSHEFLTRNEIKFEPRMAKEDYVFAATVASYARNVTVLKEVVYRYRANEDRSRESGSQRLSNDFFRDIFVASKLSEKVLQCNNASHAAIREKNRAIVDFLENRIPRKLRQIETEEEYEEFREIVEEGFGCIPADAIGHLNRHMYLFAALLISHATDEAFSVFDSTADMKHFFNVNRVQLESLPPDQLISLLIRFTPQLRRDARRGVNTTAEKLVRQFERLIVSIGKVKNDLVATARRTYHTAMYPFVLSKAYLADASIEACPAINTSTLPIWLFGERYGSHAGDNAYTLYRYVQDHHSDKISAYFVLKESSNLFEPLSTDPSLLAYGSSEHANVFAKADVYLFTDKLRDVIGNATLVHRLVSSDLLGSRSFVMLHHGVMYLKTTAFKNYHRKNFGHPIDLYVANSAFEKENLMEHSGFSEQQVQVVGFARFDELRAFKNEKNYILFMPTWRRGMGSWSIARFKRSIYFKRIQALLSSEELNEILEKSGQVLKLNLHFNMRRWIDVFESSSSHIEIVQDPDASVTELLCKCSALISDYSGVCFDVAYMDKPVLFFDLGMENEDVLGQAPISPNFKNEIFGPVCTDVGHLVQEIASTIDLNFVMKPQYLERREKFFDSVDERNLERIFNAVNDISESKRLARR